MLIRKMSVLLSIQGYAEVMQRCTICMYVYSGLHVHVHWISSLLGWE